MGSKPSQLKKILNTKEISFIMEAHNGISAKIVEEAGFKGIWASGLTLSASLGVRDNNEASWTQVLDILEYMSDCTNIPILLDGDTGYGNFNNVRRLVKKLEQRDIAGLCLEDKLFPKTNSFISGERQPLANVEEFCGKIRAAKDTQQNKDFCVVARTEAFITGWGLEEALFRAYAYAEAGADAILVHSKLSTPDEIVKFMEKWDNHKPVIIVPTKYYKTKTEVFEKVGISTIIWANHLLRSAVSAMQEVSDKIYKNRSLINIENDIASVNELFRLQNAEEYNIAEKKYLPQDIETKAIILAASKGENFGTLTENRPKCMLQLNGTPIIQIQEKALNRCMVKDITVVTGYKKEAIKLVNNASFLENAEYYKYNIMVSLYKAKDYISDSCIITFGDIVYEPEIINELIADENDIVLALDTSWHQGKKEHRDIDAVLCTVPPSDQYLAIRTADIVKIGVDVDHDLAHGEWMGILKLNKNGSKILKNHIELLKNKDEMHFLNMDMNNLFMSMIKNNIKICGRYFRGHWLDIDSIEDLSIKL